MFSTSPCRVNAWCSNQRRWQSLTTSTVHVQAFDPRGNPLKLDPNDVHWGLTDTTHFELLGLKDRDDDGTCARAKARC